MPHAFDIHAFDPVAFDCDEDVTFYGGVGHFLLELAEKRAPINRRRPPPPIDRRSTVTFRPVKT